jgi:hypothetical protein
MNVWPYVKNCTMTERTPKILMTVHMIFLIVVFFLILLWRSGIIGPLGDFNFVFVFVEMILLAFTATSLWGKL